LIDDEQREACRATSSGAHTHFFIFSTIKIKMQRLRYFSSRSLFRPTSQLIKKRWYSTPINLAKVLAEAIDTTGPISLASYMRQCLTNPTGGYYINRDPFGQSGDFITSPEISQMFGELIGIWVLTQWLAQGTPERFRVVELGPGRGTLMDDLLRAGRSFKDFTSSMDSIYMIEASPTLRTMQQRLLCGDDNKSMTKWNTPIFWVDLIKEIPKERIPTFIIAHEFFDALPIYQFEHTDSGWRELVIDYSKPKSNVLLPGQTVIKSTSSSSSSSEDNKKFHLTRSPHSSAMSKIVPHTHERYSKLPVGSSVEICPEAWEISDEIGQIIGSSGGAALIIDYGPANTIPINSLRGIKQHKIVSPFEAPGEVDLSVDVDFQALKIAATKSNNVQVHGPIEQGDWLHAMGIGARATSLANNQQSSEGKKRIESAYNRLVEKSGGAMGKVYKVMSILPEEVQIPVGFGGKL
jgi:NADH dehydrogenase [ubiquinone] 1 alpha subcomplex assembly factor 7